MSLFTEWALCVFLKSFFLISSFFPAFLLSLLRLLRSDRATQPLLDFAGGSPRQEFVFWGRNEGGCSLWRGWVTHWHLTTVLNWREELPPAALPHPQGPWCPSAAVALLSALCLPPRQSLLPLIAFPSVPLYQFYLM